VFFTLLALRVGKEIRINKVLLSYSAKSSFEAINKLFLYLK